MTLTGIKKTSYGNKRTGQTKFVVVAPHAAGDDLFTLPAEGESVGRPHSERIGRLLAESLDAFLVENTTHRKPGRGQATDTAAKRVDFNDLANLPRSQEMRRFYSDIGESCETARVHSQGDHRSEQRAVVIYIHGMKERDEMPAEQQTGMDIGIGAKWNREKGKYQGSRFHPDARKDGARIYFGKVRANIDMTQSLRKGLDTKLKREKGLRVWIGRHFQGWSQDNGIQYHEGTPDHSIQIEISHSLREEDPRYVADLIATEIKKAYKRL